MHASGVGFLFRDRYLFFVTSNRNQSGLDYTAVRDGCEEEDVTRKSSANDCVECVFEDCGYRDFRQPSSGACEVGQARQPGGD
jgi:hypothetical protein